MTNTKVLVSVFAALTVVFLMLATFSIDKAGKASEKAGRASEKASDVDGKLEAYTAGSDATFLHIRESLQRIERQLEALRADKVGT